MTQKMPDVRLAVSDARNKYFDSTETRADRAPLRSGSATGDADAPVREKVHRAPLADPQHMFRDRRDRRDTCRAIPQGGAVRDRRGRKVAPLGVRPIRNATP